jgi:DNA polymerase-2
MKGFLLTSSITERSGKQLINYFGRGEQGPFKLTFDQERPVFFIDRQEEDFQATGMERKPVSLKTFSGEMVDACYFQTQQQLYQLKDKRPSLRTFESDVRAQERFLMERFIFGTLEVSGQGVMEKGLLTFQNPQIRPCDYEVSLSTLSFDIETSRGKDLFSIGIHYVDGSHEIKEVYMVGESQGAFEQDDSDLFYCADEKSCYLAFEARVQELDPDLFLGWHVVGFDMVFLERKCQAWNIKMRLGRALSRAYLSQSQTSNQHFAKLDGRVVIDGPPFLRAAFYQFENFKLDTVAHELLGTRKDIEATGMEKVAEIERRFKEDKKALALYNLLDCTLVTDIMKKTGLVKLLTTRVKITGLLMDRLNISTAAFDFVMLPLIHRKGFVAPNVIDISRDSGAAGGHVLTPKDGLHDHVIILDFKSLYPTIMRTFNIDPYSRLMADHDPLQTPAGVKFSRTHHILPVIIEKLMDKREQAKELGDSYLSQAIKILMNSFYGVMGSAGSRFYHADLPHAITGTGQWLLREAVEFIEEDGFEVVYGDTDSVFVKMPSGDKVFERGQKLASRTNDHLTKLLDKHFKVESALEMEFETYYRKIFFPILRSGEGGAKKKYAGLKHTKDHGDELSFSGMEFVRSDWTKLAKEFQFKIYQEFFAGEPIEETIRNVVASLRAGELDHQLIYKKRLSKNLDEYVKSLPPHVKAAKLAQEAGHAIDRDVYYAISRRGPIPTSLPLSDFDYQHYIDKQIRPIAEVVLGPLGMSFDSIITGDQLSLF